MSAQSLDGVSSAYEKSATKDSNRVRLNRAMWASVGLAHGVVLLPVHPLHALAPGKSNCELNHVSAFLTGAFKSLLSHARRFGREARRKLLSPEKATANEGAKRHQCNY